MDQNTQRYGEICKTYKNSQKPDKRQSGRHGCFLKTTKNLIFKSLKTLKIWKIGPYTLKIWKKVLNIFINSLKPAKKAVWPSWLFPLKTGNLILISTTKKILKIGL